MSFDKKDLEAINKMFNTLSKAKWDSLDGNDIIEIHNSFIGLRKLEEKIKQGLEPKPAPASSVEISQSVKKSKKDK